MMGPFADQSTEPTRRPQQPEDDKAQRRSKPVARARLAVQLMAISMCVFFFQGCEKSTIRFTFGPVAPAIRLDYDDDSPLDSEITKVSPHWLLLNIIVLGGAFYWIPLHSSRIDRLTGSREFYLSLIAVAALFNSILYWGTLWQQAVFVPISHICDVMDDVLGSPEDPHFQPFLVGLASRIYFAFCLLGCVAVFAIFRFIFRRYVFTEPDRWWQFNLRSLVTLTFIVGTGLGMLLRFLRI